MKKQSVTIKKLRLSKKTISNLQQHEMANMVGGGKTYFGPGNCHTCYCTYNNENTCEGHKTCFTC